MSTTNIIGYSPSQECAQHRTTNKKLLCYTQHRIITNNNIMVNAAQDNKQQIIMLHTVQDNNKQQYIMVHATQDNNKQYIMVHTAQDNNKQQCIMVHIAQDNNKQLIIYYCIYLVVCMQFLLGVKGQAEEVTSLSLLLDSLYSLGRYHSCLETAVCATLQLLKDQFYGNDLWVAAIKNTFKMMGCCLGNVVPMEEVRKEASLKLLNQLVVCILKVMDSVYDMAENSDLFLTMPVCLPWKLFHIIISRSVLTDRSGVRLCGVVT